MKIIPIENLRKIKKAIPAVENKIKIKISVSKGGVAVKGKELDEFIAEKILQAVDFGFDVEDALLLKDEDYCLEFINIKEHTHRHNLKDVRARIVGKKRKAMGTIEELTGAVLFLRDNEIGVIVNSEHLDSAVQGIVSLIQGARHANVFAYLEKQNAQLRELRGTGLGLKEVKKDLG